MAEPKYIIPKNVSSKFEFFPGFGWKELFTSVLFLAAGIAFFFLLGLFTDSMFRLIVVALITGTGVVLVLEDPRSGGSFMSFIKSLKEYKSKPRTYEFRFKK